MHVLAVISSKTCDFFFIWLYIFIRVTLSGKEIFNILVTLSGRGIFNLLMCPSIFLIYLN